MQYVCDCVELSEIKYLFNVLIKQIIHSKKIINSQRTFLIKIRIFENEALHTETLSLLSIDRKSFVNTRRRASPAIYSYKYFYRTDSSTGFQAYENLTANKSPTLAAFMIPSVVFSNKLLKI